MATLFFFLKALLVLSLMPSKEKKCLFYYYKGITCTKLNFSVIQLAAFIQSTIHDVIQKPICHPVIVFQGSK